MKTRVRRCWIQKIKKKKIKEANHNERVTTESRGNIVQQYEGSIQDGLSINVSAMVDIIFEISEILAQTKFNCKRI